MFRFDFQPKGDLICLLLGAAIFYWASARYRSTMQWSHWQALVGALALLNSPLVQYYAAMYFNHSAMRKVHLVNGHAVYMYWIDTEFVQILTTEFSKMTILKI